MNTHSAPSVDAIPPLSRRQMLQLGSLGSFALTGCGVNKEDAPFRESSPIPTPTPFDRPEPHLVTRPELTASLEEVVAENFAESLSVAVYDYSTHEQYVFNPGFIGLEASMVKVPIALTLMRRALANHRTLTGEERERVTASLGVSENRSTRSIFSRFGDTPAERAAQLNATYELLEINLTRAHEGWGGNNTCAHDQLCIAQAVYEGVPWVSQVDLDVLRNALEPRDQDTQGWGMGLLAFPEQKTLYAPYAPQPQRIFCKNGWLLDERGIWYINTQGVLQYPHHALAYAVLSCGFYDFDAGKDFLDRAVGKVLQAYPGVE